MLCLRPVVIKEFRKRGEENQKKMTKKGKEEERRKKNGQ